MRKKFRFLTVLAVCVMVLSCFSVTAFAYADDTEQNLPVTEATQPEQQPETTPAPEKPMGEPIDDEGNAYTRDLLYDAEWENTLMEIERGKADADAFLSGIVQMTGDLVKAYPFLSDAEAQRFGTGKEEIGKCPRCGSPVYVGKGNFYCSNKDCSFCLWEDNKFFSSKKKKLTKRIAKELLDKGWCRVTGLYTPKKPQLYDAVIRLDDSGGKYVSFKMEFDR